MARHPNPAPAVEGGEVERIVRALHERDDDLSCEAAGLLLSGAFGAAETALTTREEAPAEAGERLVSNEDELKRIVKDLITHRRAGDYDLMADDVANCLWPLLRAQPQAHAPSEAVGEDDPELPDTPEARTIYNHFCDVHGLHPDEAADSTGELLKALAALATPAKVAAAAWSWEEWITGNHWSEHLSRTPPNHSPEKPNPSIRNFQPLYTTPPTPGADKLRVAVEDIKSAADSFRDCDGDEVAHQVIIRCDQALAALNAEVAK